MNQPVPGQWARPLESSADDETEGSRAPWSDWTTIVFVLGLAAGFVLLLYGARDRWFWLDEWYFLGDRTLSSPHDLLRSHNGHWVTLPVISYRITFGLWGLHTYLPYQVPVVALHLGAAVLVRQVALRMGVRSWIATAAALAFVYFGSGGINLNWGFQITLTGSVVCGLLLLLVADHDGPFGRRDVAGLALGFAGLMTSGVFPAILVGVLVALLLRRGRRVAALYGFPLFGTLGIWYVFLRGDGGELDSISSSPGGVLAFMARNAVATFESLAQYPPGAVLLGVAALAGPIGVAAIAVRTRDLSVAAIPAALLVAWSVFVGLTALARVEFLGSDGADADRYLHVSAALLLPLVALGAERAARAHIGAAVAVVVALALGVPANFELLLEPNPFTLGDRNRVLALVASEHLDDVDPTDRPISTPFGPAPVTVGWLVNERDRGRVPTDGEVSREHVLRADGRLALSQRRGGSMRNCAQVDTPVSTTLERGDRIDFSGVLEVVVVDGGSRSRPLSFSSLEGSAIEVVSGPLDVILHGDGDGTAPTFCGAMEF